MRPPFDGLPEGPARTWPTVESETPAAVERFEDACGQLVHVTVPDLIDARDQAVDLHLLYDRLVGATEQLHTALHALWAEAVTR